MNNPYVRHKRLMESRINFARTFCRSIFWWDKVSAYVEKQSLPLIPAVDEALYEFLDRILKAHDEFFRLLKWYNLEEEYEKCLADEPYDYNVIQISSSIIKGVYNVTFCNSI